MGEKSARSALPGTSQSLKKSQILAIPTVEEIVGDFPETHLFMGHTRKQQSRNFRGGLDRSPADGLTTQRSSTRLQHKAIFLSSIVNYNWIYLYSFVSQSTCDYVTRPYSSKQSRIIEHNEFISVYVRFIRHSARFRIWPVNDFRRKTPNSSR